MPTTRPSGGGVQREPDHGNPCRHRQNARTTHQHPLLAAWIVADAMQPCEQEYENA